MTRWLILGIALSVCLSATAGAAIIDPGTYVLTNHPDGSARPPLYGFRLDGLYDDAGDPDDIFTFDFEANGSAMFMEATASTLWIHGVSFGGLVQNEQYVEPWAGLWDIDFTYSNVAPAAPDDDLIVLPPTPPNGVPNSGTITRVETARDHDRAAVAALEEVLSADAAS